MAEEFEPGLVVCVTGPESTGKTAIAQQLAGALAVPLVPEVAREYLAERPKYDQEDLLAIARAQLAAEQDALAEGTGLIVCDTDLQVIQIWWEERYGDVDPWLVGALAERSERRYLLAAPDLPWEPDPLRESPHDRERLFQRYRQAVQESAFPYVELRGEGRGRFERALAAVQRWLGETLAD